MKLDLYAVLIAAGLVALRMLFVNPAWLLLPKNWQRWLFGKTNPPTYPLGRH
jgi:hypothetical protein